MPVCTFFPLRKLMPFTIKKKEYPVTSHCFLLLFSRRTNTNSFFWVDGINSKQATSWQSGLLAKVLSFYSSGNSAGTFTASMHIRMIVLYTCMDCILKKQLCSILPELLKYIVTITCHTWTWFFFQENLIT